MSLIVSEIYDALIEAGTSKDRAKAAAAAVPSVERLATKEDIANLERNTKADIARLDKRVAVLNLAVFSLQPAILALLVKLVFFP